MHGQNNGGAGSLARLLAVVLINMQFTAARVMADNMRNAICARTQTSKVPT